MDSLSVGISFSSLPPPSSVYRARLVAIVKLGRQVLAYDFSETNRSDELDFCDWATCPYCTFKLYVVGQVINV
jgi:hypothetical protein